MVDVRGAEHDVATTASAQAQKRNPARLEAVPAERLRSTATDFATRRASSAVIDQAAKAGLRIVYLHRYEIRLAGNVGARNNFGR